MQELSHVVDRVRSGDIGAFEEIVRRFQDMAVGYAFSLLGDFQLAEDAAQEAFFECFRDLHQLREPAAFPGWFRRIVFKQCDRIRRRRSGVLVPLEDGVTPHATSLDPESTQSIRERHALVSAAIDRLREGEREVVLLHYMGSHSVSEIAGFLEISEPAVKKRLFSARKALRANLFRHFQDEISQQRPSTGRFADRVLDMIDAARRGDADRVMSLLIEDPRLRRSRDWIGNTPLIVAANGGHDALAQLLLDHGAEITFHESAAIGRCDLIRSQLLRDPSLARAPEARLALGFAAHFDQAEAVALLLENGVDPNGIVHATLGTTALHAALFGRAASAARVLIDGGADVNAARECAGTPRSGWTALHYAAGMRLPELVDLLIARGARPELQDALGRTPLDVARECHDNDFVDALERATASENGRRHNP